MSHSVHNPIEVYADAACLIARDKLQILIYGLDEFVVSPTTIIATRAHTSRPVDGPRRGIRSGR